MLSTRKINTAALEAWVDKMIAHTDVYGVQAKNDKFAFAPLERAADLRLDYDVSLLPPKKYFQPQKESLLEFNIKGEYRSSAGGDPFIVFGVHPYDMVAINQMDQVFSADNYDAEYMQRRHNGAVIVSDVQTASPWSFAGYLGTATVDHGYDVLLTKIDEDCYLVEAATPKGEELLGDIPAGVPATAAELAQRAEVWRNNTLLLRGQKLACRPADIPRLLDKAYDDPLWEEKAKLCFSCGSCNLVCPTCYCFDVQDDLNWDLETGSRSRSWDGCLLRNFAICAGDHNFRGNRADRYRHRYYRKGKYVAEKIGQLACVGCGRCSSHCVAGIANPVDVFNRLFANSKSLYQPEAATIVKKEPMTALETFYEFRLDSGEELGHGPGQFAEVSIPGVGEAPISISSSPTQKGIFQMVVRRVGNVTGALDRLNAGDKVGIRGPFGTTFPVEEDMKGKDIVLVCGGIGLVPVRSAINYILAKRENYGHLTIVFGCRTPQDRLFTAELDAWRNLPGVTVLETVDCSDTDCGGKMWEGNVGRITSLLPALKVDAANTVAVVCGPPVMYKYVLDELFKLGIPEDKIFVSLERRMKCGVGKCGHCQMNHIYVCQEGPVFRYSEIKDVMEAI